MKKILLILIFPILLSASLEKVNLQLQWKHQFEFAGFYAAKEKGFYTDVGLDVNFLEYIKEKSILDEVLQGNAQYGVLYSSLIADYLNNEPVVFLANFFKQSPLVLVTQENIKSPADLKGKIVMGISDDIQHITLLSMLQTFNITLKDIKSVQATFNNNDFINKKVDAMAVFTTNEPYELNKKGIKYNILDPTTYGNQYYDLNLFTSKEELQNHPFRVKNFKEASIKGWEYALSHKDEIISLILKKYNTQHKSKETLEFEANLIEQIMLPKIYKIGSIDIDKVKMIADSFVQSDFCKNKATKEQLESFIYGHKGNKIFLTKEEKKYLTQKKEIKLCINPIWMPFEGFQEGKYVGMSANYLKIFEDELGVPMRVINTNSWSESLEFAKQRKCDILPLVMPTNAKSLYLNFTTPYVSTPLVLTTKLGVTFIDDFSTLKNEKIGLPKWSALNKVLREKYPDLNFIYVKNINDGLEKVESGKLFGYIGALASVVYMFQTNFTGELKIAGKLDENLKLSVGVRNDEKVLLDIFQKAVDSLSQSDKQHILNKWISIRYEKGFEYPLIWKSLLVLFILFSVILYWNRKLSKLNKQLKYTKQKAEDAMNVKSNFLANISHEIKTPMNSIIGMTYLVKQTHLSEVQKKYIENITSASSNLLNLINDILDLSKIEANKLKLSNIDFNLNDLLESVNNITKVKADEKDLTFKITYDQSGNMNLYGDNIRLAQILNNLTSNAVKFTNTGKVELTVRQLSNIRFKFEISDTGIGLTQEQISKLFSAFTQADESITREYGGTGLGLVITKELVQLMDGEIWVESEYGVGSKFIFEVKLMLSNHEVTKEIDNTHQIINEDYNIIKKNFTPQDRESLRTRLIIAVNSRRPNNCQPVINEIYQYHLESNDQELFYKIKKLISQYKFSEARELLNEK